MAFTTNNRYIDVLTTLHIADTYQEILGRIQLQKFIYLADTIALVWNILAPKIGHETYFFGPFDEDINNAADVLSFRGFVDIIHLSIEEKRTEVSYKINDKGVQLFESLKEDSFVRKKMELFEAIAKHVDKKGWKNLRKLVYSDPEYLASKVNGYGYRFDHTSLFHNQTLRILYDFEKMIDKNYKINKQNMLSIFFKLIS